MRGINVRRPFVLIHPSGVKAEIFYSIAQAIRKYPLLHPGHISEMLNGTRRRNQGFYAMTLELYRERHKEKVDGFFTPTEAYRTCQNYRIS